MFSHIYLNKYINVVFLIKCTSVILLTCSQPILLVLKTTLILYKIFERKENYKQEIKSHS